MDANNPDLESFRKQWQEEVTARLKAKEQTPKDGKEYAALEQPERSTATVALAPGAVPKDDGEPIDGIGTQAYHDLEDKEDARRLGSGGTGAHLSSQPAEEPKSALEHYEKAVEREDQGNLGDSLRLYRQAFRLDASVDRIYKNKHFPPSNTMIKPADPNPSNAPVTVPNTAHHSLDGPSAGSVLELIASFSTLSILTALPPTEGSPPPSCPIATLPSEILIEILLRTAIADIASFARLSLVCKRLAYLAATEDRIWERICHGHEYGFAAMHYTWATTITGDPLSPKTILQSPSIPLSSSDSLDTSALTPSHTIPFRTLPPPSPLPLTPTYPSYKTMLRTRPRIRFNGCYISTVNYHRPGASSTPSNVTYTSPVLIVTYYRYLRFFRDGTCISLLTTAEPVDVVHHLTKENLHAQHNRESTLPSAVMRHALRGRWRLSGSLSPDTRTAQEKEAAAGEEVEAEAEGDVHVETEGVDPKYMYKMHMSLRSAGRAGGTRNNKLVWKGFWSYNRLTDDWAAFTLRNDRAFFWSRVRSYGMGW
ncbi:MAG: hypothetical protein LQ338_004588 [Usnochroma carphineum]|nr:MAG: hypothetical protein LQ338_004588 [Usnochroma carphineum]